MIMYAEQRHSMTYHSSSCISSTEGINGLFYVKNDRLCYRSNMDLFCWDTGVLCYRSHSWSLDTVTHVKVAEGVFSRNLIINFVDDSGARKTLVAAVPDAKNFSNRLIQYIRSRHDISATANNGGGNQNQNESRRESRNRNVRGQQRPVRGDESSSNDQQRPSREVTVELNSRGGNEGQNLSRSGGQQRQSREVTVTVELNSGGGNESENESRSERMNRTEGQQRPSRGEMIDSNSGGESEIRNESRNVSRDQQRPSEDPEGLVISQVDQSET